MRDKFFKIRNQLPMNQSINFCHNCKELSYNYVYNKKEYCDRCINEAIEKRSGFTLIVNNMRNAA